MYKILKKKWLTKEICYMDVEAKDLANGAKPGQFLIVKTDEKGERIPLTICDYDREVGSVAIVFQVVGEGTKKMASYNEGEYFQDVVGPLGQPSEFLHIPLEELKTKKYLFVAGGVGTAPIYPQVKWFKENGIEADVIVGARSKDILILEEEMKEVANNLYICTDDGSYGIHGRVTDVIDRLIKEENKNIVKTTYKSQIEQGTVTYLYTFKEVCEKDKLPLKILSYKLAESSNSILFRELREERGLAYDVYSQMDLDENVNTMNIFTSVREESIDEVIEVIDKSILDIKNRDINFDEDMLCMMKKTHKTGVVSTLEDCSSLCSYVLVQSLAGKDITEFINSMEELETLTGEDIYRVCNKYLNKPTIHILKPME